MYIVLLAANDFKRDHHIDFLMYQNIVNITFKLCFETWRVNQFFLYTNYILYYIICIIIIIIVIIEPLFMQQRRTCNTTIHSTHTLVTKILLIKNIKYYYNITKE